MKHNRFLSLLGVSILLSSCASDSPSLKVKVLRPDGSVETNVKVRWSNEEESTDFIKVNSKGVATSKGIDVKEGLTYDVHLSIPYTSSYTYNPNIYKQKLDEELTITLSSFDPIQNGEGSKTNPYQINTGLFRVPVSEANEKIYYEFLPTQTGKYEFESLVESKGEVTPSFYSLGYMISPIERSPISPISEDNVNFKYELTVYDYEIENNQAINPLLFAASADVEGVYTMKVTRVGDYNENDDKIIDADLPTDLVECDISGDSLKDIGFEAGPVEEAIKGDDGYYHLFSQDGPIAMVNIGRDGTADFVGNFLAMPVQIILDERVCYNNYIQAYAPYLNSDGVYPLTDELKEFLIKYSDAQGLFESYGFIASWYEPGYDFGPGANYLYACSYYVEAGDLTNPYKLNRDGDTPVFTKEIESDTYFYFDVTSLEAETLTLTPDESTIICEYNLINGAPANKVFDSIHPYQKEMVMDETISLLAYRKDGLKGNVSFTYTYPNY